MSSQILSAAKKDIPLYFEDFKSFWDSTTQAYTDEDLTNCYASTLIFKNWLISLNHVGAKNIDDILKEIHEDVNASFYHAYFGNYRSAHMHLRSVIELSLQALYFIQHEVEYEQWKDAEFRIKHDELTNYLKKHSALKNEFCSNIITRITQKWIKFSKHIHAEAPIYFQTTRESSKTKIISKGDFGIWKSNHLKTIDLLNKLYLSFFKDKFNSFPSQNKELLFRSLTEQDIKELGFSN